MLIFAIEPIVLRICGYLLSLMSSFNDDCNFTTRMSRRATIPLLTDLSTRLILSYDNCCVGHERAPGRRFPLNLGLILGVLKYLKKNRASPVSMLRLYSLKHIHRV